MLKEKAFANALAILTTAFYILLYLLSLVAPPAFEFLFNAQFLGADVASLLPPKISFGNFLGIFVVFVILAWLTGYFWAKIYNKFAK